MTESASSTSGQEFDVFSVMDWKDGVGTLPGSDLKVKCLYHISYILCTFFYIIWNKWIRNIKHNVGLFDA